MWNKKVRGQKQKLKRLLDNIDHPTKDPFGGDAQYNGFDVPGTPWIEMPKTYGRIKSKFCRKWISQTEKFISQKPSDIGFCKICCLIVWPELWNSQIIVFKDEEYYKTFFDRKDDYQTWTRITDRSFAKDRNIKTSLVETGFIEDLVDEDFTHRSYIWVYAEEPV